MATQSLVMGFGGTGAHILTYLKELSVLKEGSTPDNIRFLLFDTIVDWEAGNTVKTHGGAVEEKLAEGNEISLDPEEGEYFLLSEQAGSSANLQSLVNQHLPNRSAATQFPQFFDWLHATWMHDVLNKASLNIAEGAAAQRQLGRFAMFHNVDAIVPKVQRELEDLYKNVTDKNQPINVWIVASAAGGTGAGCFVDAAFMTYLAVFQSRSAIKTNINGVIVLPNVYSGVDTITPGRSYSLIRELARFQFSPKEKWKLEDMKTLVVSAVDYKREKKWRATYDHKLFDYIYFLGKTCTDDTKGKDSRKNFFTNVANAMDLFLDRQSSTSLLQASVNPIGVASSVWATRIYIPAKTLTELFAWELVEAFLLRATAWQENSDGSFDFQSGRPEDRAEDARKRAFNLPLELERVYKKAAQSFDQKAAHVRSLEPREIVNLWLGLGSREMTGKGLSKPDEQVIARAYRDPCISLKHDKLEDVPREDIAVPTYKESRSKLPLKEAREDFANAIENARTRYLSDEKNSFKASCDRILDIVVDHLKSYIDQRVENDLGTSGGFGTDPQAPEQGTLLGRLYREFSDLSSAAGPLSTVHTVLEEFKNMLQPIEGDALKLANEAKDGLLNDPAPRFGLKAKWIDDKQHYVREQYSNHIRARQKTELVRLTLTVIEEVRNHCDRWADTLRDMLRGLASEKDGSALYKVRDRHIKSLDARLARIGDAKSSLIALPDVNGNFETLNESEKMHGFVGYLRERCTSEGNQGILHPIISTARVSAKTGGDPDLTLSLKIGSNTVGYSSRDNKEFLADELRKYFQQRIQSAMDTFDIFDYLKYLNDNRIKTYQDVYDCLVDARDPLIQSHKHDNCSLVYSDPVDAGKRKIADELYGYLKGHRKLSNIDSTSAIPGHEDKYSLTLFTFVKPELDEIIDLANERNEYFELQIKAPEGEHDRALQRAMVYHPFRAELEAWFIERTWKRSQVEPITVEELHIPPRIVRLLDRPSMMQAFVRSVITGAIIVDENNDWIWHSPAGNDLTLIDTEHGGSDIVQAAVYFALQQRIPDKDIPIRLEDAKQSIQEAAARMGAKPDDIFGKFLESETFADGTKFTEFLGKYLEKTGESDIVYERSTAALRRIFWYYAHPKRLSTLEDRMVV